MNNIRLLTKTICWWFQVSPINDVASVTLCVTRYVKFLENRIRSGSIIQKISSLFILILWVSASVFWSLFYYPVCLIRHRRRRLRREHSKNIILVSHDGALNGAPQSLIAILERLNREEFHPIVLCGSEGPFISEAENLSVPTIVLPLSVLFWEYRNVKFLYQLVRLIISLPFLFYILSSYPARVIHINSLATPDAAVAGWLLSSNTVWHIREQALDTKWGKRRISIVAALSHTIIANSKFTESGILSYGVARDRVSLIYNFLKKEFLQPVKRRDEIRQTFGVTSDDVLIGCVGRVCSDKGQDILVRAAVKLAEEYPTAHFVLIGSEDDTAFVGDLRRLIDANQLSSRIRFAGVRVDISSVMQALDVHVTPSRWEETFGRVAMEAMASGAISVVSDRGGLPEIVEDGRSGLIFAAESEIDLTAKLKVVIADPQLRQNLSLAGKQRALNVFSGDIQMAELHRIYRILQT